jgi:hypothetical protein
LGFEYSRFQPHPASRTLSRNGGVHIRVHGAHVIILSERGAGEQRNAACEERPPRPKHQG